MNFGVGGGVRGYRRYWGVWEGAAQPLRAIYSWCAGQQRRYAWRVAVAIIDCKTDSWESGCTNVVTLTLTGGSAVTLSLGAQVRG